MPKVFKSLVTDSDLPPNFEYLFYQIVKFIKKEEKALDFFLTPLLFLLINHLLFHIPSLIVFGTHNLS